MGILETGVVRPQVDNHAFVAEVVDAGALLYLIGGTRHEPTLLVSSDAIHFYERKTPNVPGLRGDLAQRERFQQLDIDPAREEARKAEAAERAIAAERARAKVREEICLVLPMLRVADEKWGWQEKTATAWLDGAKQRHPAEYEAAVKQLRAPIS